MESSPYSAAAHIPLIKSPSLRVPPAVDLPPDIHPLPDSVTPYVSMISRSTSSQTNVQQHILTVEAARRATLASHASRREGYLRSREDEKARRKREALRRIAPGFEPHGNLLVPTKTATQQTTPSSTGTPNLNVNPNTQMHQQTRSVMDDLVDQLAALDARGSTSK